MRYIKVNGHYAYQHHVKGAVIEAPNGSRYKLPDTDRLEVVEPGSVVPMRDELADSFINRGMGVEAQPPEHLIRPVPDAPGVERPGFDARPARAERAVAPAQASRA